MPAWTQLAAAVCWRGRSREGGGRALWPEQQQAFLSAPRVPGKGCGEGTSDGTATRLLALGA